MGQGAEQEPLSECAVRKLIRVGKSRCESLFLFLLLSKGRVGALGRKKPLPRSSPLPDLKVNLLAGVLWDFSVIISPLLLFWGVFIF